MWTSQQLSNFLQSVAGRQPNQDLVLSGYLNRDAAARDYFESSLPRLRSGLSRQQLASLDEAVAALRQLRRNRVDATPAYAFFIRGGQRMFLEQVPLAAPVTNSIRLMPIPGLFRLTAIRDNLDRFTLVHLDREQTSVANLELGAAHDREYFRAPFGSRHWRRGLVELLRRTTRQLVGDPNRPWMIAAPQAILADALRWIRRPGETLAVPEGLNQAEVEQRAIAHFEAAEEAQSRRLAHALLARRNRDPRIAVGTTPVLAALNSIPVRTLVLEAPTPRQNVLGWLRNEPAPFQFHDSAVWLAHRQGAHVEVVSQSQPLSAVGGSACL